MIVSNMFKYCLNFIINKIGQRKYDHLIESFKLHLKPLFDRWMRFNIREKQFLVGLGAAIALLCICFIISIAVDCTTNITNKYITLQNYKTDSDLFYKENKELLQLKPNKFNHINLTKITGDVGQAFDAKDSSIILQENNLNLKINDVTFISLINFLEQMRNSYGIFPNKLKIIRAKSGIINFEANFLVNQE